MFLSYYIHSERRKFKPSPHIESVNPLNLFHDREEIFLKNSSLYKEFEHML